MKTAIALLSLIIFGVGIPAHKTPLCLGASQARIFPLGLTDKGLLVVEMHLGRAEGPNHGGHDEMKPFWGGVCYLKVYDKNHHEISSAVLDTLRTFDEVEYLKHVSNVFDKGMKLAVAYPDFKPAKPVAITFADYQKNCSKAKILFNTGGNQVALQLKGKAKYPVTVLQDSTSIAENFISSFGLQADAMAKDLKDNLGINSVREFSVGQGKLTVVHLGSGNGIGYKGKEYKAEFAFDDINKSVFFEPVLHHGHGFDFLIWE